MWLFGRNIDLATLFLPVWVIWLVLFWVSPETLALDIPLWVWVVSVLMIDVAHVWSTIFRTYFDREERNHHKRLLGLAPLVCFVVLLVVASESIDWFWRGMAYLALFHFIKQQYGFFVLYSVPTGARKAKRWLSDKFVIYASMLYPVIYWHGHSRNFDWFVGGDFFHFDFDLLLVWPWLNGLYWALFAFWGFEEVRLIRLKQIRFSIGRVLWLFTTALNWYLGIVYFNSDLAFTLTNVVAHGIPYLVLITYYQASKKRIEPQKTAPIIWIAGLVVVGSLGFAFAEEYLWDLLYNQEKAELFGSWIAYPSIENPRLQGLVLALLALPQVVHYVLDGFIWKMNDKNPHLKTMLKRNE